MIIWEDRAYFLEILLVSGSFGLPDSRGGCRAFSDHQDKWIERFGKGTISVY